jgi:hypothetical protein
MFGWLYLCGNGFKYRCRFLAAMPDIGCETIDDDRRACFIPGGPGSGLLASMLVDGVAVGVR